MPERDNSDVAGTGAGEAGLRDAASTRSPDLPPASDVEIRAWVLSRLAAALRISESEIDTEASFVALGLDSLTLFSMTGQLAEWLDRDLPATMLFEVSSINDLAAALAAPDRTPL